MHSSLKFLAGILSVLLLVTGPVHADNGAWRVVEMTGTVRTTQPMAGMQLVSTGEALNSGAVLSTGLDGRAVLSRGEQTIVVGPNSRMSLPAVEEPGMTRIFHDLGTLLFKVDKREKHHFRVETPVIAAVVKGTTFTVTVGVNGHAVHVAEGAVEVSTLNGQSHQLVTAGLTARVSHDNPSHIQLSKSARGERRESKSGVDGQALDRDDADADSTHGAIQQDGRLIVPAKVGAKPLDFTILTDGLVQPAGNAAHTATQARFGGDAPTGQQENRASPIAVLRQSATHNNNAAHAAAASNEGMLHRNNSANNTGNGNANANESGMGNVNGNGKANGKANRNGNGNENANAGKNRTN